MKTRIALLSSACLAALISADIAAAATVGVAAAVNQSAEGTPPAGSVQTISLGDDVVHNERITTGEAGLVQLLLADGTSFTIGPSSDLTIDKFVYDPNANTAEVVATLTKGALRFLGGRAAKTNGATINAPVGVVGVRGSGADITPEFVNCTAGTCNLNGVEFPQNQSAVNTGGTVVVVATTPAMAAAASQNFQGAANTTGGTTAAVSTQVTTTVETQSEEEEAAAGDPPPAEETTSFFTAVNQEGETSADDFTQDASQDTQPPTPPPPPPPETRGIRVLTAGATYDVLNSGEIINDPGNVGLVGGSPASDQTVTMTVERSNPVATGTGELQQGLFTLPIFDDATSQIHPINDWESPFGNLNGTAYTGPGDFTAYILHSGNDVTQPFYAITGTPSDLQALLFNNDPSVRTYTFTEDPIQNLPVPFTLAGTQDSFAGAAITPFYVLEQDTSATVDPIMFQAFLNISGTGVDQQSSIGVELAPLFTDVNGNVVWDGGRRGSYRTDSEGQVFVTRGGIATIPGPAGGDQFFGLNGENFVVSTQIATNDAMGDAPLDREAPFPPQFSTTHVATLDTETPISNLSRTFAELDGYAAGVMEGAARDIDENSVSFAPVPMMNDIGNFGVRLQFVPDTSTLGGVIAVRETISNNSNIDSLQAAFGFGIDGNPDGGGSGYVDDNVFVARQNSNNSQTFLVDNGSVVHNQVSNDNVASYLMSSGTTSQDDFMAPGSQVCVCAFLEWGWWGTEVRTQPEGGPSTTEDIRAGVHLGTWVAGDISDPLDLPPIGTASFDGHAIGTVIAGPPGDTAQYIAGGSMHMDWDFGARSGRVDITNFDSHDFGAEVEDPFNTANAASPTSGFTSDFTPQVGFDGAINGSFVNDGPTAAAGVIGNFGVNDVDWRATGTFAGQAN